MVITWKAVDIWYGRDLTMKQSLFASITASSRKLPASAWGDEVTIILKEKAGALATQKIDSLQYTNVRTDYDSDYYMELVQNGHVIALGMPVSFDSDEFAEMIVKGLSFLSGQETPYLIHCTEGKDRAGFGSMIVEMLMGASEEEIVSDYLISYLNYYHLDPEADAEKLEMIADKNVRQMLLTVAHLENSADLASTDLAAAAENYLIAHGMDAAKLTTLKEKLR